MYTNEVRNAHLWRKARLHPSGDPPIWVITTAVDVASTAFLKGTLISLSEEQRSDRPPPVVTMGPPPLDETDGAEKLGWYCDECGQRSPGDLHSWGCTACDECGAAPPSMLEVERRRIGHHYSPLGRAWQSFDLETQVWSFYLPLHFTRILLTIWLAPLIYYTFLMTQEWSPVDDSVTVVAVYCMHRDEAKVAVVNGARGGQLQQSDGASSSASVVSSAAAVVVDDAGDAGDALSAVPPESFDESRDSIDMSSLMYSLTGSGGGGDDVDHVVAAADGESLEQGGEMLDLQMPNNHMIDLLLEESSSM